MPSWPEREVVKLIRVERSLPSGYRVRWELVLSCAHTVLRNRKRAKIGSIVVCHECGRK